MLVFLVIMIIWSELLIMKFVTYCCIVSSFLITSSPLSPANVFICIALIQVYSWTLTVLGLSGIRLRDMSVTIGRIQVWQRNTGLARALFPSGHVAGRQRYCQVDKPFWLTHCVTYDKFYEPNWLIGLCLAPAQENRTTVPASPDLSTVKPVCI